LKKLFILSLLLLLTITSNAQVRNNVDSLLCREWSLKDIEVEESLVKEPINKNPDKTITFTHDHIIKYNVGGMNKAGTWRYDKEGQVLLMSEEDTKKGLFT
jgi:hypothetical protein